MAPYSNISTRINFETLPDPTSHYDLLETIGEGTYGEVYIAKSRSTGNRVAIKVLEISSDILEEIEEEYTVLSELGGRHPNLPKFHGVYIKHDTNADQLWFVIELCSGGSVTELVKKLHDRKQRLDEDVIGYVIKNTLEALCFLHENRVIHRDIKGQNILLNDDAQIVLVDFGVSAHLRTADGRRNTSVGTPYFMAPEVIACEQQLDSSYDVRSDIWSLGIVAIELADGEPPHANLHPMRALFKIPRSPPPTVKNPAEWSAAFNDFIRQCLIKDFARRPTARELLRHPFIARLPPNLTQIQSKLRAIVSVTGGIQKPPERSPVIAVTTKRGKLKTNRKSKAEAVYVDDLAALEVLDEGTIVDHLYHRYVKDQIYTYVGDILIAINPFTQLGIYSEENRKRYSGCAKSENAPHIYGISDTVYHSMVQYSQNQCIVISGESGAGKTESAKHLIQHLAHLGRASNQSLEEKILMINPIMEAFGNARTGINDNSSRFGKYLELVFTSNGKITQAKLYEYLLEKGRVVHHATMERNFHIFYYVLDGLSRPANEATDCYSLRSNHGHRYLNGYTSDDPTIASVNRVAFMQLHKNLNNLGFKIQDLTGIYRILSAILHLGDVQFSSREAKHMTDQSAISSTQTLETVGKLLGVDVNQLRSALTTEVVITRGETILKAHSVQESRNARDSLAKALYGRLFDWIVNKMNQFLSPSDRREKDKHTIGILDIFGFENFEINSFEQLCINITNEQLQYFFNHSVFTWEQREYIEEGLDFSDINFCDNRPVLDLFLSKPMGLLALLDEESRFPKATDGTLAEKFTHNLRSANCFNRNKIDGMKFTVEHYAGKIEYSVHGFLEKNRDYLATEVIRLMRTSEIPVLRLLFQNPLTKTGNLYEVDSASENVPVHGTKRNTGPPVSYVPKMPNMSQDHKKLRTLASQTRAQQTLATYFRYSLMDLLTKIVSSNPHFIRCIKPNDQKIPSFFCGNKVKTQLNYTGVLETAKIRKQGFPCRITFSEFIKRYWIVALPYQPEIRANADNCKLVLQSLRLEGWAVGKSKVFLKYFHMEYLSRALKKVSDAVSVIQAAVRCWLIRRRYLALRLLRERSAVKIQKVVRGWIARRRVARMKRDRQIQRELLSCQLSRKRPCVSPQSSVSALKHRNPRQSAGQEIINQIRESNNRNREAAAPPPPPIPLTTAAPLRNQIIKQSAEPSSKPRIQMLNLSRTSSGSSSKTDAPPAAENRPRVRDFIAAFEKSTSSSCDSSSEGRSSRNTSWKQENVKVAAASGPENGPLKRPLRNLSNVGPDKRERSFARPPVAKSNIPTRSQSMDKSANAVPSRTGRTESQHQQPPVKVMESIASSSPAPSDDLHNPFRKFLRKSNWDPSAQTLSRQYLPVGQTDFRGVLRNTKRETSMERRVF